jgi:DNA-binding response OmpR family regulator
MQLSPDVAAPRLRDGERQNPMATDETKRVLVVDDDESIVETVRVALTEHGYEVIVARDGAEGLSRAERDAPDLIILDLVMPRRSGLMVLDRLSKTPSRAPHVILLTANDQEKHREFVKTCGVAAFLKKPVDIGDLIARVDSLLQG